MFSINQKNNSIYWLQMEISLLLRKNKPISHSNTIAIPTLLIYIICEAVKLAP